MPWPQDFLHHCLNPRIANYQAIMAICHFFLWQVITPYLEQLLDAKKSLAKVIQTEALRLSKQSNTSRRATSASVCTKASSIILRWHAWLQSTALLPEMHAPVENLPFEGSSLFSSKMDLFLQQIKKNCPKAWLFGIIQTQASS